MAHLDWTLIKKLDDLSRDPQVTALKALAWILADQPRAQRLLDLTGLAPADLRAAAAEPSTHRAVLDFLCGHEPDLLAASDALAIPPEEFIQARRKLGR